MSEAYQPPLSLIDLTVNRLSGVAPSALRSSNASVNVLQGNIFGCPRMVNDESSDVTPCGSSNLEYPFIAWLTMLLLLVAMICLSYFSKQRTAHVQQILSEWLRSSYVESHISSGELHHTMNTISYLDHACSMVVLLIVPFILVVMVSFIVLKLQSHSNSLYQVQYMYTTTAAFLVGWTPTILVCVYVTLSGLVTIVLCVSKNVTQRYQRPGKRIDNDACEEVVDTIAVSTSIKSIVVRLVVQIVVSILAVAINYGFVSIVYFSQQANLTAVNLAFAIIKNVMNITVIPFSNKLIPKAHKQTHSVLMMLMVNVVGPGFAVLLSSPLCLLEYFKKKSISASYEYPSFVCHSFTGCQKSTTTAVSVITPEWFYSYQCSSSFLTSYLPNFIYLYIINGILTPLLDLLAMLILSSNRSYGKQQFKSPDSLLKRIGDKLKIRKIFYIDGGKVAQSTSIEMSVFSSKKSTASSIVNDSIITHSEDGIKSTDSDYSINVTRLMPNLCVDITMLLTFGIASPLFALTVACSIIINTLLWRLALGRYISIVSKATSSSACYEKLERAFNDEWRCLPRSWFMMSVFIGMFWSLFVHDIIGEDNYSVSIIAAVMMILWCPCVFLSLQWFLSVNFDFDTKDASRSPLRDRIHIISSYIHRIIWKHVFQLDINSATDKEEVVSASDDNRSSIVIETISPLVAANITRVSRIE